MNDPVRPEKIDVVYTWVNGGDPAYAELRNRFARRPRDLNPERFRDAFQMLRYSLRSLWTHLGDRLGRVFLVTQRPQQPDWLDLNHPALSLVHHDQIFPDSDFLPTFSSNAIESCLHRIPGLRDDYLYMCDDYFLGRTLDRHHLFTDDGRPKIMGTLNGEAWQWVAWDFPAHPMAKFQHFPQLFHRPWAFEMEKAWAPRLEIMRRRRFRQRPDLAPERLYRYFLYKRYPDQIRVLPWSTWRRDYRFAKLTNRPRHLDAIFSSLEQRMPRYLCLNDDLGAGPVPAVRDRVHAFLNRVFPEPAPFERSLN